MQPDELKISDKVRCDMNIELLKEKMLEEEVALFCNNALARIEGIILPIKYGQKKETR